MSWQAPLEGGGYSFSMAIRKGNEWSEARPIASGRDLSMFMADLPGVAELPGGTLIAYWELSDARDGDPFATSVQTAISKVRHRSMAGHMPGIDESMGSIGLRFAVLSSEGEVTSDSLVQPITCECCPTSATVTARGPVVAYRGREEAPGTRPEEVRGDRPTLRDIYLMRLDNGRWTKPHLVHADNWVINACPDNGPAVDADGNDLAVAWWTRSGDAPKVLVAFSFDAGDTFGPAIRAGFTKAEGQVTLALLPGGKSAVIGWLEEGRTWARWVSAAGEFGPAVELGPTPRHSRLPRWIVEGGAVTAAWTKKVNDRPEVAVARLSY